MILLGIDPGATTGWCAYDTDKKRALASGEVEDRWIQSDPSFVGAIQRAEHVVIESLFEPHGNIYLQTVLSAITEGELREQVRSLRSEPVLELMSRHAVKQQLTDTTLRTVVCKDDATVWKALVMLHGAGSDAKPRRKKGQIIAPAGAIGEVTGHARAALAVAVAWWLARENKA